MTACAASPPHRLTFDSSHGAAALEDLRLQVLAHLQPHALPARCVYAVETVLEEWLSNVARHGGLAAPTVDVQVSLDDTEVELRFEDQARPFNPLTHAARPRPTDLADAQPGGLGLLMLHQMTQALHYQHVNGRNVLVARISRQAGD